MEYNPSWEAVGFYGTNRVLLLQNCVFCSHNIFRCICKITKIDLLARHVYASVCVVQLGSRRTDFHKIWYLSVFQRMVERIKVSLKSDGIVTGKLRENLRTFTISCWILLRARNVSDKVVQKVKTHIVYLTLRRLMSYIYIWSTHSWCF